MAPPSPPPRPAPSSTNRKTGVIAGIVAVAVLAAGGLFFATRGDDDSSGAATTDSVQATDARETSSAPASSAAPTTAPTVASAPLTLPTTAPPQTTATTVPVDSGVLDAHLGISIPVPTGWTITSEGDAPTMSDGTASLTLQALARTPSENPQLLLQEYVDTFDGQYDAVSYDPSIRYPRIEGVLPIDEYSISYGLFDPQAEDGVGIVGTAYAFIRADGLSVLYDIYAPDVTPGPGDDAFNAFLATLTTAPALGRAAPLIERDTFRVSSTHQFVPVFGLAGYTVAPGFDVSTQADGGTVATAGDEDFEVQRFEAVGTLDAAVARAQAHTTATFETAAYEPTEVVDPDDRGLTRANVHWVTTSGDERTGIISVYFDPATGNAYAISRQWSGFSVAPHEAPAQFMFQSFAFSFTTI